MNITTVYVYENTVSFTQPTDTSIAYEQKIVLSPRQNYKLFNIKTQEMPIGETVEDSTDFWIERPIDEINEADIYRVNNKYYYLPNQFETMWSMLIDQEYRLTLLELEVSK